MGPLVSVICPTFNRSTAIVPTIQSVLDQVHSDLELIVILDGCTDNTADVVGGIAQVDRRIKMIETTGYGHPSEPRNIGLRASSGELVAYIDHDDLWYPNHLTHMIDTIARSGDVAATGCDYFTDDGETIHVQRQHQMCWHPELQVAGPQFRPTQLLHRRGVAEDAGWWRADRGLEDWDLLLRLADRNCRFATSATVTASAYENANTRLSTVQPAARLTFAESFSGPAIREAAAIFDKLMNSAEFRSAADVDSKEWIAALDKTGELVRPQPSAYTPEPGRTIVRIEPKSLLLASLEVQHRAGRFVLERGILCTTTEHGRRIEELIRKRLRNQISLLVAALAEVEDVSPAAVLQ